jgi:hypothetical protein
VVVIPKNPAVLPQPVTFIATGLPDGSTASLAPNPVQSAAEFRVNIGSSVPTGLYTIRLIGSIGTVAKVANVFVSVTALPASSSSTTTTIATGPTTSTIVAGAGSSSIAVVVSGDGLKLKSGGTVRFFIRVIYASGFTTPASLQVTGLPAGVSGSFNGLSSDGTSTLFVSSTVAIIPGTYTFNLLAIVGTFQQVVPLQLTIE